MEHKRPVIGISMGDPNGIGPEVILKALKDPLITDLMVPVVYGSQRVFSFYKKQLGLDDFHLHYVKDKPDNHSRKIQLVTLPDEGFNTMPGSLTPEAGRMAVDSFCTVVNALQSKNLDAIVTAPIHKQNTYSEAFPYKGHTEYLAHVTNASPLMILSANDPIRIALATVHIPLNKIAEALQTPKLIAQITQLRNTLITDFGIQKPKLAILGLNPHAGDEGLMGQEEQLIIKPAILNFKPDQLVFGPYAADAFFAKELYKSFDAVLAMYHDQGLIPFKMKAFYTGVNITAGIPLIRTSPDHGTAFDIAGKNLAHPDSFREALYAAVQLVKNKSLYQSISQHPLPVQERRKER